ncbi:MAG: isoleucine--tRNA ligase [Cytophagales bacterium]|nr:MAG: isoleucine--tRNA ligase [Cytophagales bacterium]
MKYKEYKNLSYTQIEKQILEFWKKENIFEKSISSREGKKPFIFYEGPPSANGMPGIHHVMARTIKDIFCRFQTLSGKQVHRKAGWDTHGLPIELQVEKELGITKDDIGKTISIEEYNQKCRETVMRYTDVWEKLTEGMGYWVDMQNPYITYKNEYIETVWFLLKKLYDKKVNNQPLLYKGYTIQPYSPKAGTGLSSHELNLPGCYRDVTDTSITAQFKVKHDPQSAFLFEKENEDLRILAWTTTPWTLPANCALAVGEKVEYVKIKTFNPYTHTPVSVILAKALIHKYFNEKGNEIALDSYQKGDKIVPYQIIAEYKGKQLEGIHYEQLMPYITNEDLEKNAFRVIIGDFVTTEDGTGIVHTASVFGADDFRVAKQNNVPAVLVIDEEGNWSPLVNKQGQFVAELKDKMNQDLRQIAQKLGKKENEYDLPKYMKQEYEETPLPEGYLSSDILISILLKEQNKAFKVEKYVHAYPHCWRTDKPILYYPLDSWFVRTTALKDKLAELNKTINWKPESTGTGRFGNWLENLVDWNLSRQRYWGIPLPIWVNANDVKICLGGRKDFLEYGINCYFFNKQNLLDNLNKLRSKIEENIISLEKMSVKDNYPPNYLLKWREALKDLLIADKISSVNFSLLDLEQARIPVEYYKDYCLKKIEEKDLENLDLHRPYVDDIYFIDEESLEYHQIYKREPDLIDVWFDSGAMPYAQNHYPFNPTLFPEGEKNTPAGNQNLYPADFISEGVDQTRGWFFTLHAIAGMLFDSVAFKNVVSTGLVLDQNGEKMSKSKGNVVEPFDITKNINFVYENKQTKEKITLSGTYFIEGALSKYGADATRWYMVSNANPWDNLKFSWENLPDTTQKTIKGKSEGIEEVVRKFFGTLQNTYNFFALYANLDQFEIDEQNIVPIAERSELDRWIISVLQTLILEVTQHYQNYEPTRAARALEYFLDSDLSNWYVRLSRKRFWKGEMTKDKKAAYETLYECLNVVAQLMSPIAPFFAEWLYQNLTSSIREKAIQNQTPLQYQSVHLTYLTQAETERIDKALEEKMRLAQIISSLTHSLRKKAEIRVRQPLQKILIPILDPALKEKIAAVTDIILAEVNIKEISYIDDDSGIVVKSIKPNFKTLGAKYKQQMKEVTQVIQQLTPEDLKTIEKAGVLEKAGFQIILEDLLITSQEVQGLSVASEEGITVALDLQISEALHLEGIARDIVNRVQNLRKDQGLEVKDRISIEAAANETLLQEALSTFQNYICQETQAESLAVVAQLEAESFEIDQFQVPIRISVIK